MVSEPGQSTPAAGLILHACYSLQHARRYQGVKAFFRNLLVNAESPSKRYFDMGMIVLVIGSIVMLLYAVENDTGALGYGVEAVVVGIFVCEYLLRLWVHGDVHSIFIRHHEDADRVGRPFSLWPPVRETLRKKWDYVSSPMAIIDLLAILPSYRSLRILRLFLLFRLFKLFRYSRSVTEFAKVLDEKRFELYTLLGFVGFIVFMAGTAFYFFEHDPTAEESVTIFEAMYWSVVTISTVGYGDFSPQSTEGRLIAMGLIVAGMGTIAFFTSIVVSAFNDKLEELREQRLFAEIERKGRYVLLCGYGRVGRVVADMLKEDRKHFVVVDRDPDTVASARKDGCLAIEGNAARSALLTQMKVAARADTVLCVTGDDVVNVYITLAVRGINPDARIIARANRSETGRKLRLAGADHVVSPYQLVGLIAAEYVDRPASFAILHDLFGGRGRRGMEPVHVPAGSYLAGRPVGTEDFAARRMVLFGIVTTGEEERAGATTSYPMPGRRFHFAPPPAFVVEPDDMLVVVGDESSVEHLREQLSQSSLGR